VRVGRRRKAKEQGREKGSLRKQVNWFGFGKKFNQKKLTPATWLEYPLNALVF
jgi:hypothetical protein